MNKKWVFLQLLLLIPIVTAMDSNYNIIVEENGNSLVIVEFDGKGLVNLPLPEDVADVRVKGALYTLNNNSIDISIGSTEKAVALYKTSLLTTKQRSVWSFTINLVNTEREEVAIAIPNEATIIETEPEAVIESLNHTRLVWNGDIKTIEVKYRFPEAEIITFEDVQQEQSKINFTIISAVIFIIMLSSLLFLLIKNKKSNKQNIIKTLSKNESVVVTILMQHKGSMKRNKLEKLSKLAKSSLANTLNNLERKKIIGIDKTYTTHYIKFTRWFNEL